MNSGVGEEGGWGWERERGRAVRSGRMRLLMREKWKNRAMWRSDGERWNSSEKTCCCKVHIPHSYRQMSSQYLFELQCRNHFCGIRKSCIRAESCHGPTGPLAHCETEMVPRIDSKKHISKPSNTWIHLTCVLLLKVQTGETRATCYKACISV